MKKILLVIAGMAIAAALVGTGWIFGARERFMTQAYASTVVDKDLAELMMKEMLLNQIEEGKIDDAKRSLRMDVDTAIVTIDAFRDDMDSRSLDMSRKIFSKIAQDRVKFPNASASGSPQMDSRVVAKIELILKQAGESQTNK
jgi:hypothetical protein